MGRKKHPDPVKHCAACGELLERKQYNGRWEDMTRFKARKYCDLQCTGRDHTKDTINTHRGKARRHRKDSCETCDSQVHLQVHHVDFTTANDEPSNLMTLCASCHATWHWEHGKKPSKAPSVCRICGRRASGLGLCGMHRLRLKLYGDPFLTKRRDGSRYVLVRETSSTLNGPASPASRRTRPIA